jgi:hypothetical protein
MKASDQITSHSSTAAAQLFNPFVPELSRRSALLTVQHFDCSISNNINLRGPLTQWHFQGTTNSTWIHPSSDLAAGTIDYQGSFVLTTIVTNNATTRIFSSHNLTHSRIPSSSQIQPDTSISNFPSETSHSHQAACTMNPHRQNKVDVSVRVPSWKLRA